MYQGNVDASTYITAKVVESTTRRDTVQVRMEQNTLFATGPIYQKLDGNLKSTEANIVSYTIDTFAKGTTVSSIPRPLMHRWPTEHRTTTRGHPQR